MALARWSALAAWLALAFTAEAQFPESSYTFALAACGEVAYVCSDYDDRDYADFDFYVDGVLVTAARVACNQDTAHDYALSALPGDGWAGPFELDRWEANGAVATGGFTNPDELVAILNANDPAGNWAIDFSTNRITGGVSGGSYSDLEVTVVPSGAEIVVGKGETLLAGGSSFAFGEGTHVIEAYNGANLLDEATVTVTCPSAPTSEAYTLYIPEAITVCPDLGALSGPVADLTFAPDPRYVDVELGANDCLAVTPLAEGTDSLTVTYCDAAGACGTAVYVFDVQLAAPITTTTVYDTVPAPGSTVTYCVDTLELPGTVVTVTEACATGDEEFVGFILAEETACVKYRGLTAGGTDTSCVVVCDDLGFCDTTVLIVTTVLPDEFPELEVELTIEEGLASSYLLNTSAFGDPLAGIVNSCPDISGAFVGFRVEPSNYSVDYTGLAVGTERACIDVTDAEGRTQRTNMTVHVVSRAADRDTMRIRNGDTRRWCFGAYELGGAPIELYDDCVDTDPRVRFGGVAGDVTCIDIEARELGFQTLCMTLCDGEGVCDRVNLLVEVVPNSDDRLPRAEDDYYVVSGRAATTVFPLDNDFSLTDIVYAAVVSGPTAGAASFNGDFELEYRLGGDPCGDATLVYEICNAFGCDQATVTLDNDCDGGSKPAVINRSGFSPNGDGVNDTWEITNIEFYPTSTVKVYNRWGSRVLETRGYENDWDGSFGDANLPDGTYYFVLDLDEPGAEPIAGYVQLRR